MDYKVRSVVQMYTKKYYTLVSHNAHSIVKPATIQAICDQVFSLNVKQMKVTIFMRCENTLSTIWM